MVCRMSTKWSEDEISVRMSTTATRWSRSRSSSAMRARSVAIVSPLPDGGSPPSRGRSTTVLVMGFPGVRSELGARVADDAIASRSLGYIECVVGGLQQRVAVHESRVRPGRDTAANRCLEWPSLERKPVRRYPQTRPLGERHRRVDGRAGEEDQKLLAAIAADVIDLAHGCARHRSDLAKHFVARPVAKVVVHQLEVIEVEHRDRQRLLETDRVLEHLVKALVQPAPIVEPREWIGHCELAQLRVRALELGLAPVQRILQRLDAQHRAHACLELEEFDGLGDVVVGAGAQATNFLLDFVE